MNVKIKTPEDASPTLPWYRYWQVWMVVLGPAVVVVASVFTYFIAAHSADPILARDGSAISTKAKDSEKIVIADPSMAPALLGRNHAATGVKPSAVAP